MKIKKATRISILAVAAVAIMGIATVSFAAWQGSTRTTVTANADTGYIEFLGFAGDQTTVALDKYLVPFDQEGDLPTYDGKEQVTMLEIDLPAIDTTKNFTINVKFASASDLDIRAKVSNAAVTAPADDTEAAEWTKVTTTDAAFADVTYAGDGAQITGYKLYIILVSGNNKDMKQTANFTVTLAEKAA